MCLIFAVCHVGYNPFGNRKVYPQVGSLRTVCVASVSVQASEPALSSVLWAGHDFSTEDTYLVARPYDLSPLGIMFVKFRVIVSLCRILVPTCRTISRRHVWHEVIDYTIWFLIS